MDRYQRERKFFVLYDQLIMTRRLGFASTAISVLEEFEKESMAKARKGLSITINDALEDTAEWPLDAVRDFDRILEQNGAATLTELRINHSRKYRSALKRGKIRSEVEYHLIKGIVDGIREHVPENELPLLDAMLIEYERKVVENVKASKG